MSVRVDHGGAVARRKLGALPDGWEVGKWRRVGADATIYYGSVATVRVKGKYKGSKKWEKFTHEVVVTDAEQRTEELRYESATGKCHQCADGKEWFGWSRTDGNRFRQCSRCAGSGSAPEKK